MTGTRPTLLKRLADFAAGQPVTKTQMEAKQAVLNSINRSLQEEDRARLHAAGSDYSMK